MAPLGTASLYSQYTFGLDCIFSVSLGAYAINYFTDRLVHYCPVVEIYFLCTSCNKQQNKSLNAQILFQKDTNEHRQLHTINCVSGATDVILLYTVWRLSVITFRHDLQYLTLLAKNPQSPYSTCRKS